MVGVRGKYCMYSYGYIQMGAGEYVRDEWRDPTSRCAGVSADIKTPHLKPLRHALVGTPLAVQ